MEEIKIAQLLAGFRRIDDENINSVYLGYIQPETSDEPLLAYFKILPLREILVEATCSLMARHLGLPTPEPYLIIMDNVCPDDANPDIPAFGTVDANSPSFRRYLKANPETEIEKILLKWKYFTATAAFDEFIGNCDRNEGNWLYDGKTITLIDHGLSIRETQRADKVNIENKLFSVIAGKDDVTRMRHRISACNESKSYGKIPFNLLAAKTLATHYIDDLTIEQVVSFLRDRLDYLEEHIAHQLNFTIKQKSLR